MIGWPADRLAGHPPSHTHTCNTCDTWASQQKVVCNVPNVPCICPIASESLVDKVHGTNNEFACDMLSCRRQTPTLFCLSAGWPAGGASRPSARRRSKHSFLHSNSNQRHSFADNRGFEAQSAQTAWHAVSFAALMRRYRGFPAVDTSKV